LLFFARVSAEIASRRKKGFLRGQKLNFQKSKIIAKLFILLLINLYAISLFFYVIDFFIPGIFSPPINELSSFTQFTQSTSIENFR
jgi:hypothetical protein